MAIGQYADQVPDSHTLIFGGLRWKIKNINKNNKTIEVVPAEFGEMPSFSSSCECFYHEKIRKKVLSLYQNKFCPAYLNKEAKELFEEALHNFYALGLDTNELIFLDDICYWFPWCGDQQTHKLSMQLRVCGIEAMDSSGIIALKGGAEKKIRDVIKNLSKQNFSAENLLAVDEYYLQRPQKKYDYLLPEELKRKEYCLFMYQS
jgi:ATP-dependent Lhr-like helicase